MSEEKSARHQFIDMMDQNVPKVLIVTWADGKETCFPREFSSIHPHGIEVRESDDPRASTFYPWHTIRKARTEVVQQEPQTT